MEFFCFEQDIFIKTNFPNILYNVNSNSAMYLSTETEDLEPKRWVYVCRGAHKITTLETQISQST